MAVFVETPGFISRAFRGGNLLQKRIQKKPSVLQRIARVAREFAHSHTIHAPHLAVSCILFDTVFVAHSLPESESLRDTLTPASVHLLGRVLRVFQRVCPGMLQHSFESS